MRKKIPKPALIDDTILPRLMDSVNLPINKTEQKFMSECLQEKTSLLPENYRAPLLLKSNGYTNKEIAEILDCSLENAKIRLHRARKKMKQILGYDCEFYYDERNVLC